MYAWYVLCVCVYIYFYFFFFVLFVSSFIRLDVNYKKEMTIILALDYAIVPSKCSQIVPLARIRIIIGTAQIILKNAMVENLYVQTVCMYACMYRTLKSILLSYACTRLTSIALALYLNHRNFIRYYVQALQHRRIFSIVLYYHLLSFSYP